MKLEKEIKQKKFGDPYFKSHINILYTASWLAGKTNAVLKPYNISRQQFNILRILRGQYPEPASVKILSQRMIDKMSNASRLVDKLKKKGLVNRRESRSDRRQVEVVITKKGLSLLKAASNDVEKMVLKTFGRISAEEAKELNKLLDFLRG